MTFLELVIKEFIAIVEVLEETEPIENEKIIIETDYFKKLMEEHAYMKFREKTKIYKELNFLIHDKNNYTMPYWSKTLNKNVRKVVINYDTFKIVKKLYERDVN